MRRPQLPQPCYHWLATLTLLSLLPLAQENISRKIYFCINVNKVSVLSAAATPTRRLFCLLSFQAPAVASA